MSERGHREDYSRVDSHEVERQRSDHLVVLERCEPVVSDVKRKSVITCKNKDQKQRSTAFSKFQDAELEGLPAWTI